MSGFLSPRLLGNAQFGSVVSTRYKVSDVRDTLRKLGQPIYHAGARSYLVPYENPDLKKIAAVYPAAIVRSIRETGVVALYQKCTDLGCKVPFCPSSQWFECPCHGAAFTLVGEAKAGPAPRGLDLFPVGVRKGRLLIDTRQGFPGLDVGIDVSGQRPKGPHCVGI